MINISKNCTKDPSWWLKTYLVLADLDKRRNEKIFFLNYLHRLFVAVCTNASDNIDQKWSQAGAALLEAANSIAPWLDLDEEAIKKDAIAAWEEYYGKLNDPKTLERIKMNYERMQKILKERKCPQ